MNTISVIGYIILALVFSWVMMVWFEEMPRRFPKLNEKIQLISLFVCEVVFVIRFAQTGSFWWLGLSLVTVVPAYKDLIKLIKTTAGR